METIFWILLFGLFWTYLGYPLAVFILALIKKLRIKKKRIYPFVTFFIAVYNEENGIEKKLKNTLDLNYPKDKLEVIVVSDGSTDKTNEIVRSYEDRGIKLFGSDGRCGKITARKRALSIAGGEILIFSDAASIYEKNALEKLAANFNDSRVGCVGGRVHYVEGEGSGGVGEPAYWDYELFIRRAEGNLGVLVAVSGSIYAVREELYPSDMPDFLADDLLVPAYVRSRGYYSVYEPEAFCYEYTNFLPDEEFKKRERISIQNFGGLLYLFHLKKFWNCFKYDIFSIGLVSHKLFRMLLPAALSFFFFANIFLMNEDLFYRTTLLFQTAFYLFALYGILNKTNGKLTNLAGYFLMSNIAVLSGMWKFFRGEKRAVW